MNDAGPNQCRFSSIADVVRVWFLVASLSPTSLTLVTCDGFNWGENEGAVVVFGEMGGEVFDTGRQEVYFPILLTRGIEGNSQVPTHIHPPSSYACKIARRAGLLLEED